MVPLLRRQARVERLMCALCFAGQQRQLDGWWRRERWWPPNGTHLCSQMEKARKRGKGFREVHHLLGRGQRKRVRVCVLLADALGIDWRELRVRQRRLTAHAMSVSSRWVLLFRHGGSLIAR